MRVDPYGERVALRAHEWSEQSYPLPVYIPAPRMPSPYTRISPQSRRMISLALLPLDLRGDYFIS